MTIASRVHPQLTEEGSTLVEVLIATLVFSTGLLAMADLVRLATSSNVRARSATIAGIVAGQKLEQLLSLDFDDTGGLQESPWSLQRNTPDFVDHVDGGGAIVGQDVEAPASAVYTRRWSIERLPAGLGQTVLIQVLVTGVRSRGPADRGSVVRLPGDARLVAIKARRAP
jgi:type II secretory pathway pseudopilin PulG